jgi:transcriptional regulator with GAF, ATPase, and Fis domain
MLTLFAICGSISLSASGVIAMNKRLKACILRQSVAAETEIVSALRATNNNWTAAAARLGITFRQFRYLMQLRGDAVNARLFGSDDLLK